MSQNVCTPLCDSTTNYVFQSLSYPINKHDVDAKPLSDNDYHTNLKKKYRKSSSNRLGNKIGMLVYLNQSNKLYNDTTKECDIANTKKSTSGLAVKHNSYDRYLAKKRGEVLYKDNCK
jgi:hypothetical protein